MSQVIVTVTVWTFFLAPHCWRMASKHSLLSIAVDADLFEAVLHELVEEHAPNPPIEHKFVDWFTVLCWCKVSFIKAEAFEAAYRSDRHLRRI